MDFSSIGFLFVIVMVSGIIAYLTDVYGKKLGKKRISFLGLRPRDTARFGTVAGGMFLSGFAILALLVFVTPVRRLFLDGSKALKELQDVQSQLGSAKEQVRLAQTELKSAELQKKIDQESISKNAVVLGQQSNLIVKERGNISTLKRTQLGLQNSLNETRGELVQKTQQIHSDQDKINATDQELRVSRFDLQKVKGELTRSAKESKSELIANRVLLTRNDRLNSDIDEQTQKAGHLKEQINSLEQAKKLLEIDKEKASKELSVLDEKLTSLNKYLTEENKSLDVLNEAADFWNKNTRIARLSPLTYHRLQEICRISIPANIGPDDAQTTIDSILRTAQREAENRGAKAIQNLKAAEIMGRPDGTTPDEIKTMLTKKLAGNRDPKVLIAVSSINAFADEPVPIDFIVRDNPTIYYKGERIEQCDLDGSGTNQQIFDGLEAFGRKLKAKAQHDKMIPQADEDSFGSLPADQVLALVDQIKQAGRRVRLQAVCQSDTRAADPLKLNFRINE